MRNAWSSAMSLSDAGIEISPYRGCGSAGARFSIVLQAVRHPIKQWMPELHGLPKLYAIAFGVPYPCELSEGVVIALGVDADAGCVELDEEGV